MSLRRPAALVRKELLHIIRDPRNLFLVTLSPAFLLFLLSYVFSFDVGQLDLAVLDLNRSALSRRYVSSLTSDRDLVVTHNVESYEEALLLLVGGDVDALLVIPPGFSDEINAGTPSAREAVQVQAVVDGADPFAGGQALRALEARSQAFVANRSGLPQMGVAVDVSTLAWYNPGLESLFSMVSGLLAIVLIMPTMAFALALAREKETGTLESLLVTPISALEYLGGKMLAYLAAGLVSAVLALLVAVLWFKIPFRGSLWTYLLLSGIYLLACMGIVVVIVSFIRSQQTAMFVVMLAFLVPSFFLAGLTTPVVTESWGARLTSYALPTTHFVEIGRSLFLKGLSLDYLQRPALILLGMGVGAVVIGLRLFKKRVS
jgi:ABC-2 type transport system permease protein